MKVTLHSLSFKYILLLATWLNGTTAQSEKKLVSTLLPSPLQNTYISSPSPQIKPISNSPIKVQRAKSPESSLGSPSISQILPTLQVKANTGIIIFDTDPVPTALSTTDTFSTDTSTSTSPSISSFEVTSDPSPTPTIAPGNDKFQLLGCYNESSSGSNGSSDSHISPILSSPNALTVPVCLDACYASSAAGRFQYAALENGSQCTCIHDVPSTSTTQDSNLCSLPCPADQSTSCGGNGYLLLYQRRSNSTTLTPTTSTTTSSASSATSASTSTPKTTSTRSSISKNLWIGIAFAGLGFISVLSLLGVWFRNIWKRKHPPVPPPNSVSDFKNTISAPRDFVVLSKAQDTDSISIPPKPAAAVERRFGVIIEGSESSDEGMDARSAEVEGSELSGRSDGPRGSGSEESRESGERSGSDESEASGCEKGRQKRDTFEFWKKGVVPPLKTGAGVGDEEVLSVGNVERGVGVVTEHQGVGRVKSSRGKIVFEDGDEEVAEAEVVSFKRVERGVVVKVVGEREAVRSRKASVVFEDGDGDGDGEGDGQDGEEQK